MRRIRIVFVFLFALLAAPAGSAAHAQAAPAEAAAAASTAPSPADAPLPGRTAPPRTLRAYWHVFAAFTVAWALLFGYVVLLGRRFGRMERDLAGLARAPEGRPERAPAGRA
jgi:CcmD family protein